MAGKSRARAVKKKAQKVEVNVSSDKNKARKISKKIKKSPVLILVVFALVVGAIAGYFSFSYLSDFSMLSYSVNGEAIKEVDYAEIDITAYKEKLESQGIQKTMDEIYDSYTLEDKGVECKFFGVDISNTVSIKYFYREDISHDAEEVKKIDIRTAGVYYIEYTSSHFAFKNTKLIRTIVVMEVENDG